MTRPQRAYRQKDNWPAEPIPRKKDTRFEDAITFGTSINFNSVKPSWNSILERAAEFEVANLDADLKWLPLLSSNSVPNAITTETTPSKKIGANLGILASAEDIIDRSMNVRPRAWPHITLSPVQEWEGYVEKIESDHIVASLVNLTNKGQRVSALSEIPLEELDTSDVKRLRVGMIFRWAVGYMRRPGGQKIRGSRIVFRDLPAWTKRDVSEAKANAAEMAKYFASQTDETP
jgi:hypothetical protein